MDAVEYLKEAKRMCDTVGDCRECPLNSSNTVIPCKLVRDNWELTNPEKIVAIWELEMCYILTSQNVIIQIMQEELALRNPVDIHQMEIGHYVHISMGAKK